MARGRPRQPIETAKAKGADKVNPGRYKDRQKVVKSDMPLGRAPAYMDAERKAIWFELESHAIKGVMTGSDRVALEGLTLLVWRMRNDPDSFRASDFAQMRTYMGSFGMTPVDRAKLQMPAEAPKNEFDDLDS